MYTFKQIINNQEQFRDLILVSMNQDINEAKVLLKDINCVDEYILKEKSKLENSIRNIKKTHIERLFFMHPNRDKEYYVWWDENLNEPLILRYE